MRHAVAVAAGLLLAAVAAGSRATAQEAQALLAYETPDGIHFVNEDGSGRRKLPGTRAGDQNPRWSPDGTRLVFWNDAPGYGDVYVVNADGSGRRKLSGPLPESAEYPNWSPDGRLIAFESWWSDDESWHVYVMRPDGSGVRRVTPPGRGGTSPEWSPDGRELVYAAAWLDASLAVIRVDGTGLRTLETVATDDWAPAWSRDGAIAFNTVRHGKPEIYVLRDGRTVRLTENDWRDFDAVWSPDAQKIAFTTERTGLSEVYVMNADGSEPRRVTREPVKYACCADWRP